jgi:hypothetical protein
VLAKVRDRLDQSLTELHIGIATRPAFSYMKSHPRGEAVRPRPGQSLHRRGNRTFRQKEQCPPEMCCCASAAGLTCPGWRRSLQPARPPAASPEKVRGRGLGWLRGPPTASRPTPPCSMAISAHREPGASDALRRLQTRPGLVCFVRPSSRATPGGRRPADHGVDDPNYGRAD